MFRVIALAVGLCATSCVPNAGTLPKSGGLVCAADTSLTRTSSPSLVSAFCTKRGSDVKHGPIETRWKAAGVVAVRGHYADGDRDGRFEWYYKSGAKRRQGEYRRDRAHGTWIVWSPDGKVLGRFAMQDGSGVDRDWHANGSKSFEIGYAEGRLHGTWRSWHDNGRRWAERTYSHGRPHGTHRRWDRHGRLAELTEYKNGKWISGRNFAVERIKKKHGL